MEVTEKGRTEIYPGASTAMKWQAKELYRKYDMRLLNVNM